METKIPIYKQRGEVVVIRDRWWWYRIITLGLFIGIWLMFVAIYKHYRFIGGRVVMGWNDPIVKSFTVTLVILYGMSLAIIETKRVFSKKKK